MLIKDSIILIQKDEHEFDELIYYLKDYYHIIVCPYDYTEIKIKAIDSRAWIILCSFKGVKQNDFWDKAKEIDNLIVLSTFKELAYHASDKGDELECYLIKENDCRSIADYILYKDCLLSDEYYLFIGSVKRSLFHSFAQHASGCRLGMEYMIDAVSYVLFSEKKHISLTADIYPFLMTKNNVSNTSVESALRRFINFVMDNKEDFIDEELFKGLAAYDNRISVKDFIFEISDRYFFLNRDQFSKYNYFNSINRRGSIFREK